MGCGSLRKVRPLRQGLSLWSIENREGDAILERDGLPYGLRCLHAGLPQRGPQSGRGGLQRVPGLQRKLRWMHAAGTLRRTA